MSNFFERIKDAWNIFINKTSVSRYEYNDLGVGSSYSPSTRRLFVFNERSMIASIYTRLGIDVSSILLHHVNVDSDGNFLEIINSGLNRCLSLEANIDQSGRGLIQDIVMSLCDEGVVAVVPVDVGVNPAKSDVYEILSLRVGKIEEWFPKKVRVNLYNDRTGLHEDVILDKSQIAIIENPLYNVMNEPNSTLRRLINKLNILDAIDNQSGSGKLDLIIQLPYAVKSETRQRQAEERIKSIEDQLTNSKYGVAYTDSTEHITQLNRPVENNLMKQIEYLTNLLYSQLGITSAVFDGTADEKSMLNYYNRTVAPILNAILDSFNRSFIIKERYDNGEAVMAFRDPFGMVTAVDLAKISDSFTRNAILTSNEIRGVLRYKPSKEQIAGELSNKNISQPADNGQRSEDVKMEEDSKE